MISTGIMRVNTLNANSEANRKVNASQAEKFIHLLIKSSRLSPSQNLSDCFSLHSFTRLFADSTRVARNLVSWHKMRIVRKGEQIWFATRRRAINLATGRMIKLIYIHQSCGEAADRRIGRSGSRNSLQRMCWSEALFCRSKKPPLN